MQISLRHIDIHPALRGYVEKLWVFESSGRVPDADLKLVVPNGMIKLVIPYRNGLVGHREGLSGHSKEHQMTLIGISDVPFVVEAEKDSPSGTIGVEFSSLGAYRFFRLKQSELKNQIYSANEVLGKMTKEIEEQISQIENVDAKVKILQLFLIRLFNKSESDRLFEFCVRKIRETNGGVSIAELERATGYSGRWLNLKFDEKIGVSPKNLGAITRFLFVYETLANNPKEILKNKAYYNIYYDQAHFIKEFKRFTGLPPSKFENKANDFGKIFYKK
jgi:AraC-like DNA-binding protein